MKRTQGNRGFGSMGASSVLMIFVVLCLTTFGVLSLVSAKADLRLTDKTLAAAQDYYAADAGAEVLLSRIDAVIAGVRRDFQPDDAASQGDNDALYQQLAAEQLQKIDGVSVEGKTVSFTVPAGDFREIAVRLSLHSFEDSSHYTVQSRTLRDTRTGENLDDDVINLWPGF